MADMTQSMFRVAHCTDNGPMEKHVLYFTIAA